MLALSFSVMSEVVTFVIGTDEEEFNFVLLLGNTCLMFQNFQNFPKVFFIVS